MALEGTLKDFSLADIFQLIGIQKKTGILVLREGEDIVRVSFHTGMIVSAESESEQIEPRLGHVLVRKGVISQEQLSKALEVQAESLQRLGQVLVEHNFISSSDLKEALRNQVLQIVYSLFRWKNGHYHFSPQSFVDYDKENFEPISTESILMEGLRMLDEWPLIERVIDDSNIVFVRTEKAKKVRDAFSSSFDEEAFGGDEEGLRITPDQQYILQMIDGVSSVKEIADRSKLLEFETYRNLYDLIEGQYVEKSEYAVSTAFSEYDRLRDEKREYGLPAGIVVIVLFLISLFASFSSSLTHIFPSYTEIQQNTDVKKVKELERLDSVRARMLNRMITNDFRLYSGSLIKVGENRYMLPGQYGLSLPFSIQLKSDDTSDEMVPQH